MKERLYLSNLYDYYGNLLTLKQKEYFEEYYFNNLSLAEISDNKQISRNAVHKALKEVQNNLLSYEKELKIYEKTLKINVVIDKKAPFIKDEINKILES